MAPPRECPQNQTFLVLLACERLLDHRPQVVDFPLESAMDVAHGFGHHFGRVDVGFDVVRLVRFRAATGDHDVGLAVQTIRLRPVPIEELHMEMEPNGLRPSAATVSRS